MTRAALLILFAASPLFAQDRPGVTMEVRLNDGSKISLALLDESIPIQTPHGKLVVPLADIRRIEFGARLPEAIQKQIDAAIVDLASPELSKREAAGNRLVKIGKRAYPAVLRACKSTNRDQAISAKQLREKFAEAFPEERLPRHEMDVIHTDDAKLAGRIEVAEVRVQTPQFGEKKLRVIDLASVRVAGAVEPEVKVNAEPDPGNLTNLAQQTGKSFHFKVTGAINGSVYGTDLYTTDSTLATACVHAGVLKMGETGVVKVTIEPGAASYTATTRNGVTSYSWGQYHASYKVKKASADEDR